MVAGRLHPTENRGYRELYAMTQRLASHWSRLAERLDDDEAVEALTVGATSARRLLEELASRTAGYGLHGYPAARGVGARWADAKNEVGDRFLERNQALRLAVLDVLHVKLLLAYLAEVAEQRDDESLVEFCRGWDRRLARVERPVRRAAVAAGQEPDAAIQPVDGSPAGRAAHQAAYVVGTLGEWFDRRAAGRAPSS